jgi:predicted O-methyltransferase YrrM
MDHFFENIHGWASFEDQGHLINLILDNLSGTDKIKIAEIGVYKGRGTALWNVELINRNIDYEYYAIDNFEGSEEHKAWNDIPHYEHALSNLAPIKHKINLIKSDSIEASQTYPDGYFDIIYIDAAHDYESVKKDILAWLPKLKTGGTICGDDYTPGWPAVIQAVDEIFDKHTINVVGNQQWWKTIK